MKLPDTHLHYLHVIYELSKGTSAVRSACVAERMGVSRPSVARMLGVLAQEGLIGKEPYGRISLTDEGLYTARCFGVRVKLIEDQIAKTELPFPEEDLRKAACVLAASLSDTAPEKRSITSSSANTHRA